MLISSDLANLVARLLGQRAETVQVVLRRLRDDGLISIKGRGRYAIKMTIMDATNLIIAMATDTGISNRSELVRALLELPERYRTFEKDTAGLGAGHTFGQEIAAMLQPGVDAAELGSFGVATNAFNSDVLAVVKFSNGRTIYYGNRAPEPITDLTRSMLQGDEFGRCLYGRASGALRGTMIDGACLAEVSAAIHSSVPKQPLPDEPVEESPTSGLGMR
jgi:predicted transcriptional regulator